MAVVFEPGPQLVLARVSGAIDLENAAELREDLAAALAASRCGLDIDMSAVTSCGGSGVSVLLDLSGLAADAGKSVVLTALSSPVARLLWLNGADRVLTVSGPAHAAEHFQMETRRCGPILHLTPVGELDMDTRADLDEVQAALDGVDVVACDMRDLNFLDVAGLHGLLDFAHCLDERGIAFFAYNWRPQPRRLLDLVDERYPAADPRGRPTRMLRRLQDFAAAARTVGAARARKDVVPRAATGPLEAKGR